MARPPHVTVYFETVDQYNAFINKATKEGFKSKSAYGFKVLAEACNLPSFFASTVPDNAHVTQSGKSQEASA